MSITVEIKVKRDKGEAKTYQMKEVGESKKGNYKLFSPIGKNPDLPEFGKLYINTKRGK